MDPPSLAGGEKELINKASDFARPMSDKMADRLRIDAYNGRFGRGSGLLAIGYRLLAIRASAGN
jgi:hypothetical protein